MICPNCGSQNAPGDQFCGSCGNSLQAAPAAAGAAGQQQAPINQPAAPTSQGQWAPSGQGGPAPAGYAPDVICWKCGRRNPPGRSFCIQCGEKLEAGTAAGAGSSASAVGGASIGVRGGASGQNRFGGRGRTLAIGAALIVLLLVGAVAAAALLNRPAQGPIAAVVESPSPSTDATASGGLPTPSDTFASALPTDNGAGPSPSDGVLATPTPSPTPSHTPKPTKRPTPTPPPTVTPSPTPVTCANAGPATKWFDLNPSDERTIPTSKDWCIRTVTFTNLSGVGAAGTLQLFLNNPTAFYDFPSDFYYGWLEANIASDFNGSDTYSPKVKYPKGYMLGSLYASTVIKLDIPACDPGICGGSVHIGYTPISALPH